ncbi:MAG: hypothetical protein EPO65_00485 [Dehalococcoidia bacterium]|nr:MAG: hypothetical protein EPO65_00485 [Dehalococcoidia bacterium]
MPESQTEKAHTHQHPRWTLAIKTRTRLIGTLNLAVALRGASCGWGTCEKPRRTFKGFHRLGRPAYHRAIEVEFENDPDRIGWGNRRRLLTIPLGSGPTTWRFSRKSRSSNPPGSERGEGS